MVKIKFLFLSLLAIMVFASCGEYNKILKSTDSELKYTYAKKYYDQKKYGRTITLIEELLPIFQGTSKGEEALFLLAQSYFYDKDYISASSYYNAYVSKYPKGEYAELARYNSAYGLFLDSPQPELDQTSTIKAMQQFSDFIDLYPQSDKKQLAQESMFALQEKLAFKELQAIHLYFNLGNYMGNNYESCVVTAREALKTYPYSKYAEEFQIYILRSKVEQATQSIEQLKAGRFREVIDERFNYDNMFVQGKYAKEAERYYRRAMKELGQEIEGDTEDVVAVGKDAKVK